MVLAFLRWILRNIRYILTAFLVPRQDHAHIFGGKILFVDRALHNPSLQDTIGMKKFRALCIDYHADAVSRLEETKDPAVALPHIIIRPASDGVEPPELESESECESVHEEKRVPRPKQAFKRKLLLLEDDASFSFLRDEDPMHKKADEFKPKDRESENISMSSAPEPLVDVLMERRTFHDSANRRETDSEDSVQEHDRKESVEDDKSVSMSVESDCESVPSEKRTAMLPQRASKRALPPLHNDASFNYLDEDPLVDTDDEVEQNERKRRPKSLKRKALKDVVVSSTRRKRLPFRDSVDRPSAFDSEISSDDNDWMNDIENDVLIKVRAESNCLCYLRSFLLAPKAAMSLAISH